jgi:predicted dehydrogenase
MFDVRLITLDPGHFHAALVQKEMYPGVDARVHVYAPLGSDLLAHLSRIAGFNARKDSPTHWQVEVHAGPDFRERCLAERSGTVVVLSGRNRDKIDYIQAAVEAGLNVLADKPWVLRPEDRLKLQATLDTAAARGLVVYDIMTERYEITSILQRELVHEPAIFGEPFTGTADEPGVFMESVHYLSKVVAGVPLRRPAWFFDVEQQGEGLTDVGTHLVDLVPWVLFPGQAIEVGRDVRVQAGERWPTLMSRADFQKVTGEADFPEYLRPLLDGDTLPYFCNSRVRYTVRGIQVRLDVLWDFEAAGGGGDTHLAVFRGGLAHVDVRQGKEQDYHPELYVVANRLADHASVLTAVKAKVGRLQDHYPGVAVADQGGEVQVTIPPHYRTGHEAHFGEVTRQFLQYLRAPGTLPAWEKPNLVAKYFITTEGVRLARSLRS